MKKKISDKDIQDWKNFIEGDETLLDKDNKIDKKKNLKIKRVDLHGYTLLEANKKVEDLIQECFYKGVSRLTVVIGKGLHSDVENDPYVSKDLSILKYSVPEFINKNKDLMKYVNFMKQASIDDGGDGAFYIYLKKNNFRK